MTQPARHPTNAGHSTAKVPVAILISGRGSNMRALVEASCAPDYPARIAAVISNRPEAAGVTWAREQGLAVSVIDHTLFKKRADFDAELSAALAACGAEFLAFAGFMRILGDEFIARWEGRMINIHPSLLPLFTGLDTHAKALTAGVRIAGCTVHYVTSELDSGPIIAQAGVAVLPDDTPETLAERVLMAEHCIYPHVLRLVAAGKAPLLDGKVVLEATPYCMTPLFSPDLPGVC